MSARSTVVALLALLALAAPALAATETATSGTVTATLSYDHVQDAFEYTRDTPRQEGWWSCGA